MQGKITITYSIKEGDQTTFVTHELDGQLILFLDSNVKLVVSLADNTQDKINIITTKPSHMVFHNRNSFTLFPIY